ncbi:MAG TPA: MFS transporter [Candidatus Limnocylindrales bacterium]|nr:MFS transporter [Candidatus Limnocylindrales bacterium]
MSPVVRSAIVYVVLFAAVGAWFPYVSVYYRHVGLSLEAVGLLTALYSAVGLVAAPAWGAVVDHLRNSRGPLAVAGAWSALAAALLLVVRDPLPVTVAVAFLAAGTAGMGPMVDNRTIELLGDDRDRFGRARAFGSAAFIVAAIGVGALVTSAGPPGMFLVYVPLLALTGLAAYGLLGAGSRRPRTAALARGEGLLGIVRAPTLGLFFAGSVVMWTAVSALTTFLSVHLVALGADGRTVGIAWALGAAIEVPLMFLFPLIVRRVGAEWLLVVGALAFGLRSLGWALVDDPTILLAIMVAGGVGFAFFYVGTVTYVARAVPIGVQATAQGVFSGTAFSFGSILGSVLGGVVAGASSLPILFGLSSGLLVVAAVVVWWAVVRRGPEVRSVRGSGRGLDSRA